MNDRVIQEINDKARRVMSVVMNDHAIQERSKARHAKKTQATNGPTIVSHRATNEAATNAPMSVAMIGKAHPAMSVVMNEHAIQGHSKARHDPNHAKKTQAINASLLHATQANALLAKIEDPKEAIAELLDQKARGKRRKKRAPKKTRKTSKKE
jgi:hypothetical protein